MDLTENIKKRWQEYTEELYKKDLHDPDNHNGVITHLESRTRLPGVRGERNHSLSVKGRPGQQSGVGQLCSEVADSVQSGVRAPPTGPGKAGSPS